MRKHSLYLHGTDFGRLISMHEDIQFFIKDMNSTNGIKVNGGKVSESILEPGAKLQIGETVLSIQ